MKVILFGATGMVGQGVLLECLRDPEVERVLAPVRAATGQTHEKLEELPVADFFDYSAVAARFAGYDACLFCLGVSSAGMKEPDYRRLTYDLTLAAARALHAQSPGMKFLYVSGAGTDSTEKGGSMWARVKGQTENALLALGFGGAFMFRPGFIQPLNGVRSKTRLYRAVYAIGSPLYPLLKAVAGKHVTTSEQMGRAMLAVAKRGAEKPVLENADINVLGAPAA